MSTHEYAKGRLVVQSSPYTIVRAATSDSILQAALLYASMGLSVLPLNGKKPIIEYRKVELQES